MISKAVLVLLVLTYFMTVFTGWCMGEDYIHPSRGGEDYSAEWAVILKENPVDLKKASYSVLISIPGFPSWLARRLMEVLAGSGGREQDWINMLTPRELSILYRFSDYIILPSNNPVNLYSRTKYTGMKPDGCPELEEYLSLRNEDKRFVWRARQSGEGKCGAAYANIKLYRSRVIIHGGDFLPDFAMGLMFKASSFYYPFTSRFPVDGYRWIAGRTSFYGRVVRGAAAELQLDTTGGTIFAGWPGRYRQGGFVLEDGKIAGARFEFKGEDIRMGVTSALYPDRSRCAAGLDGRWIFDYGIMGWELIPGFPDGGAMVWGINVDAGRTETGFLFHLLPPGVENCYAGIPGTVGSRGSAKRGVIWMMKRRFFSGTILRCAVECSRSGDAAGGKERLNLDAGVVQDYSWGKARLSWSFRNDNLFNYIPFPVSDGGKGSEKERLKLVLDASPAGAVRLRTGTQYNRDNNSEGFLLSGLLRFRTARASTGCDLSFSLYRSLRGTEYFYFYQPSLKGEFPWKMCGGNGWMGNLNVTAELWGITITGAITMENGTILRGGLQMEYKLKM